MGQTAARKWSLRLVWFTSLSQLIALGSCFCHSPSALIIFIEYPNYYTHVQALLNLFLTFISCLSQADLSPTQLIITINQVKSKRVKTDTTEQYLVCRFSV